MDRHTLLVEGWRFIPHSFAVVNQFQLLALVKRGDVRVVHRDLPLFRPQWPLTRGLLPAAKERIIADLPDPGPDETADAALRVGFPYDLAPARARRTFVYVTAEFGRVSATNVGGRRSLAQEVARHQTAIVTPSRWSAAGVIASGVEPGLVHVVPHGVDPEIFRPLDADARARRRVARGWTDEDVVFLTAGALTGNKGIYHLLRCFAHVVARLPCARLVIKGLDPLYPSWNLLRQAAGMLAEEDLARLERRVTYIGQALSFAGVADLYQTADAYVSPYLAEGFNLPVLEAAACGLPVICSRGGPTDDFVDPSFALPIETRPDVMQLEDGSPGRVLNPNIDHLEALMVHVATDSGLRARARRAGPAFVHERFSWDRVTDQLCGVLFGQTRPCTESLQP